MQNKVLEYTPSNEHDSYPAVAFIERLARALHRFGVPSHRMEEVLTRVAERFNVRGQFFATPTAVFASLEGEHGSRTALIRVEPGEVNLEKLSRLDHLLHRVISGQVYPADAIDEVDRVVDSPPLYGPAWTLAAFSMASATASRFFGGGWREFVVCAVIGLVSGALAVLAARFPGRLRVFEPLAAFAAGMLAAGFCAVLAPTSVYVAMCAGLIVLIPGLTLTIGINELATRHLAAGTVRLTGAMMLFLQIGFGVLVGLKIGRALFGVPPAAVPAELPAWTLGAALLLAPLSFTVLFQANRRDALWIAAASALAFIGARTGSQLMGIEMGAFTGALLVGIASNLHARTFNRPASVTLVPGIMLLVPGSVGFQSLSSLIARDIVSGMETAFTMGITGIALVTGLLLANAILSPRRPL